MLSISFLAIPTEHMHLDTYKTSKNTGFVFENIQILLWNNHKYSEVCTWSFVSWKILKLFLNKKWCTTLNKRSVFLHIVRWAPFVSPKFTIDHPNLYQSRLQKRHLYHKTCIQEDDRWHTLHDSVLNNGIDRFSTC